MVDGGRAGSDRDAVLRAEYYGPVVLDRVAPTFWGAGRATNNTAELTALLEALVYLRDVDGTTAPAIVCSA